ncbi:MAG: T9SS type A sorting domain-containing protein, partial [Bacteroidota bacterium]
TDEPTFSLQTNGDHHLFLFSTVIETRKGEGRRSGNFIIIDEKLIILTIISADLRREKTSQDNAPISPATLQHSLLYPNPNTGIAYLEYEVQSADFVQIELINQEGKVIRELQANTWQLIGMYQLRIDSNGLPPGTYYCRIKTPQTIIDKTMIKQ